MKQKTYNRIMVACCILLLVVAYMFGRRSKVKEIEQPCKKIGEIQAELDQIKNLLKCK